MRTLALFFSLLLTLTIGAQESRKLSAGTAILLNNEAPRQKKAEAKAETEKMVSAYLTINPATLDREAIGEIGAKLTLVVGNTATVRVPLSALEKLAAIEGIEYIQAATAAQPMLDIARAETGAEAMQQGTDLPQPYTGKGVVVGVVDSGFDYGHAAFRDSDGRLRIKRVWEQDTEPDDNQSSPATFGYGIELSTAEEIEAAGGDIRGNSHGTHVTSIAAGSPEHADGTLRGMAPDADIVLVSMTQAGTNNVNISNAIAYIFAYADETNQPCVVNLSLGANSGPHDGTSTFDQLADGLQGPGRLIIGAAGNFRNDSFHIHRDFSAADNGQQLSTFIDYKLTPSEKNMGGDIDFWASEGADIKVSLVLYKLSTCAEIERAEIDLSATEPATLSLGRNVSGSFTALAETSPLNGKLHIALQSAVTAIRTDYAIAIEVIPNAPCALDIWADDSYLAFTSNKIEGFVSQSPDDSSICEIGGTANRILTVGAYTTRATYKVYGDPNDHSLSETDGELCSFSANGPTADGRVKPAITAPGAFISAAVSDYDNSGTIVLSQFFNDDGRSTSYGYMEGTSMAAPFVTGIVAAWLQACPSLTPEELADAVRLSARTDDFTGSLPELGSNLWGHGKIDALAGLRHCLQLSGIEEIAIDEALNISSSDTRIYNLSGICLGNDFNTLPRGIYLLKQGNRLKKVIL